jgi:hypothetical protein
MIPGVNATDRAQDISPHYKSHKQPSAKGWNALCKRTATDVVFSLLAISVQNVNLGVIKNIVRLGIATSLCIIVY